MVRAASADEAMRAVDAIKEGGISVLEITMTVPNAARVIETVAARFGAEVVVGAGTVLDAETARTCILAGAQFVVSPVLDLDTIACCRTNSIAAMPGALAGASRLGVGTDLVDIRAIREGQGCVITKRARQFLEIIREARNTASLESSAGGRRA